MRQDSRNKAIDKKLLKGCWPGGKKLQKKYHPREGVAEFFKAAKLWTLLN